jgi:hypothetical protein
MAAKPVKNNDGPTLTANIDFIRQMLGELRKVAESEEADLLCYLIEMAYVEAGDIQVRRLHQASIHHGEGH